MKINLKLIILGLIISASNLQAITLSDVKSSANNIIDSGKQKFNEAKKWASEHKKDIALGACATIILGTTIYIIKLKNDLDFIKTDLKKKITQAEIAQGTSGNNTISKE